MAEVLGTTRTDCLYPCADQVEITVVRRGGGYRISDEGGAALAALRCGIEGEPVTSAIHKWALRFGAEVEGATIYADAPTVAWVQSARLAVANASSQAAYAALSQQPLKDPA